MTYAETGTGVIFYLDLKSKTTPFPSVRVNILVGIKLCVRMYFQFFRYIYIYIWTID